MGMRNPHAKINCRMSGVNRRIMKQLCVLTGLRVRGAIPPQLRVHKKKKPPHTKIILIDTSRATINYAPNTNLAHYRCVTIIFE
jgi:hypothetical protein